MGGGVKLKFLSINRKSCNSVNLLIYEVLKYVSFKKENPQPGGTDQSEQLLNDGKMSE